MECASRLKECPSGTVTIDKAGAGDAAALSRVLQQSYEEYRSQYTPEAFAATTPPPEGIIERLSKGPIWTARVNGSIAGTIGASAGPCGLYIQGMGVLPEYRGRGIGRRLFETVERYAEVRGYVRLYLSTHPFLEAAIRLYETSGFRILDRPPRDYHGVPVWTMEKLICWQRYANLIHKLQ